MPMIDDAAIAAEGMESLTPWRLREPAGAVEALHVEAYRFRPDISRAMSV
jgi:hypothetical protein